MKEYELDKSTGEVTWKEDSLRYKLDDGPLTKEQYEMIKKVANVEEIEMLNRLLDNYVLTSKNDGFKKVKRMDKLFTIPKEKPLHRMKDGSKYTMPLSHNEIIQLLKMNQWNVDDKDAVLDLVNLIRSVEKVHGVV